MLHHHRTHTPLIRLCVVVDCGFACSDVSLGCLNKRTASSKPQRHNSPCTNSLSFSPPLSLYAPLSRCPKHIKNPSWTCSTMSSDKKSSSRPPSYSGSSNDPFDSKSQSSTKSPKLSPEPDRPKVNRSGTGKRAFSAYAQTWIGMTPVWLMGEALIPGVKVGTTFKGGARKLLASGEEILEMIGASKCVVFALAACLVLY